MDAYRRYCWPVASIDDLRLAPFHLLAGEGEVYAASDHLWHMETLARLAHATATLLLPTPYLPVDVTDAESEAAGVRWWEELTGDGRRRDGGKAARRYRAGGRRGPVQPGIKCRGRSTCASSTGRSTLQPENLERLRDRSARRTSAHWRCGSSRSGIEGLQRFVRREPLYRVHECVFAVLALESEPVDPRL